ncbi:MAG: hypothetical protein HY858_05740 [Candidatus Solibacter usitatus]|nr:hypothetical protein [Candidatus Solibacter usitatus]
MRRLILSLTLFGRLISAQAPANGPGFADPPHKGTNFDPPPKSAKRVEDPPPPAAEPERPFFELETIDWGAKETWVKLALLLGSLVLARRAFLQMKGDY